MTPARGALLWAGFISCVLGLSYAVYTVYPDRPSAPKEYPDGLEVELGGPGALRVSFVTKAKENLLTWNRLVKLVMQVSEW